MADFGKVAVLMGGRSAEREISLMTGSNVFDALKRKGVDAHRFDPAERGLFELIDDGVKRVFIALHGRHGEDGVDVPERLEADRAEHRRPGREAGEHQFVGEVRAEVRQHIPRTRVRIAQMTDQGVRAAPAQRSSETSDPARGVAPDHRGVVSLPPRERGGLSRTEAIEPERRDAGSDQPSRARATSLISIRAPSGREATPIVVRAG